jgi:membrane protein YqaA with SNARE-associated domain
MPALFFEMNFFELGYIGLFAVCFLAATILPLSSEGVLLAFLFGGYDPFLSLLIASLGNIMGGSTNYWLGRIGNPGWLKTLGMNEQKILNFENRIQHYGYWSALLSWLPIIGDPILVALGFFRANWWRVFALMSLGKIARYSILILPWFIK